MTQSNFLAVLFTVLFLPIAAVPARTLDNGKEYDNGNKGDKLHEHFYSESCPLVEAIVRHMIWIRVAADPTLAAKLLRLQYHDCFVRGCDASVLLDSIGGETVEKDELQNLSLGGYDVIDEVKLVLELLCPGTVSCADILALAARDAVSYQFGKPMWDVFTGRRDGRVSLASEASSKIPSGYSNFTTLQKQFSDNGLDVLDLVALSGAHTIGMAHCVVAKKRFFNFTGIGDTDPSLDPAYARRVLDKCTHSPNDQETTVEMDPGSSLSFDSHYYVTLGQNRGLFQSDAVLLTDSTSASYVKAFEDFDKFMDQFGVSMKKMGNIGVLTQNEGEVRKNCRVVNTDGRGSVNEHFIVPTLIGD
ncbi:peroxidase 24-like [Punica granatum]|uniref:Peroxidase n=2 Tax=Punica granatum TaxID=22663 RepID=A0A2I0IW88_PUNGR|nr:peroxidase 24-like [Punica granatum]PKI48282.1 hypothetical protein CRG98_031340 [Punica granatum]